MKTKEVRLKNSKDLSKVTVKEFFEQDFENDMNSNDSDEQDEGTDDENEGNSDSNESDLDPAEHKMSLMKLKDTDPEFYNYLKDNDKSLLEFNISDDEDNSSVDDTDNKHIPNANLEVASDDSDFEADETHAIKKSSKCKITLQLLKTWQEKIQTDRSITTIKCVVEAFHAALESVAESSDSSTLQYKVEGSAVFNGVVQLCIMYLPDAFKCFLKLDSGPSVTKAHKSKRFPKIRSILKSYLADLIKILQHVTSANVITVLLKHLHQMLPYTQSFSSLTKPLLRILLKLWSAGEDSVRVVAFLNILRVATTHKETVLETLLKTMYVKYVENAKFVSPNTLPGINFMKHSLVEIYLLDYDLSYSHAFLYIRQLAIHLRNAITLKKKEHFQAVYNWQYINSLRFWTELLTKQKQQSMLRSLVYPLVQIIIGTIKVIPTVQYYPLRFHCVQMLMTLSKETGTFIPVLSFLLEILNSYDFNKKHKTVSMKPVPFTCILRMSKSQLGENGFKDNIIETIYQLILENAANESHTIYFSDLYIPCVIQLKAFLKKCHVATYCRKIKQLLDKIEENRKFIETERSKRTIDLANMEEITNWENSIKKNGTSIAKFYASWIKIHESQKLKLLTKNEEIGEYNLPVLKKSKKRKFDEEQSEEESELEFKIKETNGKAERPTTSKSSKSNKPKKKKVLKKNVEDDLPKENTDIVKDTNYDDWD